MAKYRKIDPRIWNDAKFMALSDDGKLLFFFLLTHPHMTALGAMRNTKAGMAEELGWSAVRLTESLTESLSAGMAKASVKGRMVWLPNFLKYNSPESPNVIKAWVNAFDMIPECGLKSELLHGLKGYAEGLTKGFREAFKEAFRLPLLNQEQEPEQEQEQEQDKTKKRTPAKSKKSAPYSENFERFWLTYPQPRRKEKPKAGTAWKAQKCEPIAEQIISKLQTQITQDRDFLDGYEPYPERYLKNRKFEDEINTRPPNGRQGPIPAAEARRRAEEAARQQANTTGGRTFDESGQEI